MNFINLSLMLIEIIILFYLIYRSYKKYKIKGLYFLILIFTFVSNIFLLKRIEMYTFIINSGLILNTMIFIICNIIIQKKGPYAISNVIIIIFLSSLFNYVILSLSGIIAASNYDEHFNMLYNGLFEFNMRSYFAALFAYLISIFIGSKIYYLLKKEKNKVWISNTFSMIVTQMIESIIFIFIMYIYDLSIEEIILMILYRYIIKIMIGIISNIIQIPISKLD